MTFRRLTLAFLFALPTLLFCQTQDTAIVRQRLDSLYREARQMYGQGKIKEGISSANICVEESAKYASIFPLKYANALDLRAAFYLSGTDQGQAEADFLESRRIRIGALGERHPDVAKSNNNLGIFYRNAGQLSKADTLFHLAAEVWLEAKDSIPYAQAIHNRATAHHLMGKYHQAEEFYLTSQALMLKLDSLRYARSLSDIGYFYLDTGKWRQAEASFLESKQILSNILGRRHPLYGNVTNNLATLYARMGNFKKARESFDEMGSITAEAEGKQSDNYGAYCNNIGNLLQEQGDYDSALGYLNTAKQIRSAQKGELYASTLVNIGKVRAKRNTHGDYDLAITELEEAVSILENYSTRPAYIAALQNLAFFYWKKGRGPRGSELYLKVLGLREEQKGDGRLEYAEAAMAFADFNLQIDKKLADSLYLKANLEFSNHLDKIRRYSTEEELLEYLRKYQSQWDFLYTYASRMLTSEWSCIAYNNALSLKNVALQNLFFISVIRHKSESTQKRFDRWQEKRRHIEEWSNLSGDQLKMEMEEANLLEKSLIREVDSSVFQKVTWKDVHRALRPREVAIEFITYHHYNSIFDSKGKLKYAALVLRSDDEEPTFVPLCEESALVNQLEKIAPGFPKDSDHYISKLYSQPTVYQMLWQPIEKVLRNDTLIYFAPSGELHKLNLDAIVDSIDIPLSARYHLIRLGSTRQIVVSYSPFNAPQSASGLNRKSIASNNALLFTDINYSADSTLLSKAIKDWKAQDNISLFQIDYCGDIDTFVHLTTTMKFDTFLFGSRSIRVEIKPGFDANEECFKQIGREKKIYPPRILHLDTHGFFDPINSTKSQNPFHCAGITHPLLRSGIALAGANQASINKRPFKGMEDGILTAYEVSQCDLRGTELVVLSACETGLGDIVDNEGVYGLQRAFKIAGAQNIIMSLWKVTNHEFKNDFFAEFYKNWLDRNMDIRTAFRIAQEKIRDKWPDPYHWAVFVLVE